VILRKGNMRNKKNDNFAVIGGWILIVSVVIFIICEAIYIPSLIHKELYNSTNSVECKICGKRYREGNSNYDCIKTWGFCLKCKQDVKNGLLENGESGAASLLG